MVASASIIVVALLMAPVHDNSQFVGSHSAAEQVTCCALMTAARIGADLKSESELGSAIEQRDAAGVRRVGVPAVRELCRSHVVCREKVNRFDSCGVCRAPRWAVGS